MCLAVPAKVKKIDGKKILVQYPREEREVFDGGIPIKVGDYVMVQMGIVIKKISPKEAKISIDAWNRVTK